MSAMHHVPGRLRVRLRGVKGNPARAHCVERELEVLDGITAAESNIRTGSVIVHYDTKTTNLNAVLAALDLDYVSPELAHLPERDRNSVQKRIAQEAALAVLSLFVERALERSVPSFLAALL